MFSAFEWMIAMRYLRARRQEGFISVIAWFSLTGIALGVATLIIVMSVMNGFRQELLSKVLGINGHMNVYGQYQSLTDYERIAAAVRKVPGVTNVIPMINGQVMASANGQASGAIVRGVKPTDIAASKLIAENINAGDLTRYKGSDGILLGSRLARKLGVGVGSKVTLISPKGNATPFGTVPRMRAYNVAGTFQIGMHEYDSSIIFMPLEAAQLYFKLPKSVSYLDVTVDDPDKVRDRGQGVWDQIGRQGRIVTWQQSNASFFNAIQVERNVMFLILTLIIVVAAFNIISSMIMLVKDKGHDIAIMRTMGATRGMVLRVFLISGASIGVIGTFAGFVLGLAFASNIETIRQWIEKLTNTELFAAEIYFLSQLPAVVDPTEVITVVLMGLGLSLLATIYPSWRAARLDPVEALRYE